MWHTTCTSPRRHKPQVSVRQKPLPLLPWCPCDWVTHAICTRWPFEELPIWMFDVKFLCGTEAPRHTPRRLLNGSLPPLLRLQKCHLQCCEPQLPRICSKQCPSSRRFGSCAATDWRPIRAWWPKMQPPWASLLQYSLQQCLVFLQQQIQSQPTREAYYVHWRPHNEACNHNCCCEPPGATEHFPEIPALTALPPNQL